MRPETRQELIDWGVAFVAACVFVAILYGLAWLLDMVTR